MTQTFELAGHRVNRMGFGAMQLPGPGVFGPPRDPSAAIAVLRRAIELGVNHIDTAQFYGPDVSNELIRAALHPYPADLLLVTKVGARRDEAGDWLPAQRPEQLVEQVEQNLRSLAVERLGVVNLRVMDGDGHELPADQQIPLADQLGALVELREAGKIGGIGLSTVTVDQLRQGGETTDIVCVQNPFSLVAQDDRPMLTETLEHQIAYAPYFPLGSAFPNTPRCSSRSG